MSGRVTIHGIDFQWSNCIECGVVYTVPLSQWQHQQQFGGNHFCSNGHEQGWAKDGCENARLKRERDRLKQQLAHKDDVIAAVCAERDAADRSAAAYEGQTTRLKRRAGAGLCPCCKRQFTDLKRHMAAKHADYADTVRPDAPLKVVKGGKP